MGSFFIDQFNDHDKVRAFGRLSLHLIKCIFMHVLVLDRTYITNLNLFTIGPDSGARSARQFGIMLFQIFPCLYALKTTNS